MSLKYSVQNSKFWSGIRAVFDLPTAPIHTPVIDPSHLNLVYDAGAGGWADAQVYVFRSDWISINGAAGNFYLAASSIGSSIGTRPGTNTNRRITKLVCEISGGAVTPIASQAIYSTAGAGIDVRHYSLTNPLYNEISDDFIIPAGQDCDFRLSCAAGGVGDQFRAYGVVFWNEAGAELVQ